MLDRNVGQKLLYLMRCVSFAVAEAEDGMTEMIHDWSIWHQSVC